MGRAPGTDFKLAGWETIGGWFDQFGEKTPTAMTLNVGTSTEGRPVRICVISSSENLANLDRIKEISQAIGVNCAQIIQNITLGEEALNF